MAVGLPVGQRAGQGATGADGAGRPSAGAVDGGQEEADKGGPAAACGELGGGASGGDGGCVLGGDGGLGLRASEGGPGAVRGVDEGAVGWQAFGRCELRRRSHQPAGANQAGGRPAGGGQEQALRAGGGALEQPGDVPAGQLGGCRRRQAC